MMEKKRLLFLTVYVGGPLTGSVEDCAQPVAGGEAEKVSVSHSTAMSNWGFWSERAKSRMAGRNKQAKRMDDDDDG
jgi:hypothetical protein